MGSAKFLVPGGFPRDVATPAPAASQTYDLSAQAQYVRGRARTVRAAFLLPGLVILGVEIWLLLPPYNQNPFEDIGLAAVAGAAAAILIVLGLRSHVPHLIDRLTVTADAFQFHETDGTDGEIRWTDPAFGLTLVEHAREAAGPAPQHVWLLVPNGGRGAMSPEVAAGIVLAARTRGLAVLVRRELEPTGRPEVTRIGTPEHSPGWKHAVAA